MFLTFYYESIFTVQRWVLCSPVRLHNFSKELHDSHLFSFQRQRTKNFSHPNPPTNITFDAEQQMLLFVPVSMFRWESNVSLKVKYG